MGKSKPPSPSELAWHETGRLYLPIFSEEFNILSVIVYFYFKFIIRTQLQISDDQNPWLFLT
jgi:hypothetical protein